MNFSSTENEEINVSFKNKILRCIYQDEKLKFDLLFTLSIAFSDLEKKKKKKSEIISLYVSGDKSLLTDFFPEASVSMA